MAMSQVGYVMLTGYVTAEPKMWHTARTQTPVAKVRVGSTPRRLDRQTGEWQDGETSYYTVKCWRKLAENVTGSLRKGDMVIVRGKVRIRTWVDDQQRTRTEVEIEADSVGHDLAFGWSHFNRGVHVPPRVASRLADGEMARQGMAPDADLPDDAPFPGEFDDYEDAPPDLRGDGAGGPGGQLAPATPEGPLTSQDAPRYPGGSESSGDEQAFAELTRDYQPKETAAPF
jgi:single-strand DNA-binding protein